MKKITYFLFVFLSLVLGISIGEFSICLTNQTGYCLNQGIKEHNDDNFGQYAFRIDNCGNNISVNYEKSFSFYEPMCFRTDICFLNGQKYTMLESWDFLYGNGIKASNTLFPKINCWYGNTKAFNEGFSVGISSQLYMNLFPGVRFNDYKDEKILFNYDEETIEANIELIFDNSIYMDETSYSALYTKMYGDSYFIVNKNISSLLNFKFVDIVCHKEKCFDFSINELANDLTLDSIYFFDCFQKENNLISTNYNKFANNNLTRMVIFLSLSALSLISISVLVFVKKIKLPILIVLIYFVSCLFVMILLELIGFSVFYSPLNAGYFLVTPLILLLYFSITYLTKGLSNNESSRFFEIKL